MTTTHVENEPDIPRIEKIRLIMKWTGLSFKEAHELIERHEKRMERGNEESYP